MNNSKPFKSLSKKLVLVILLTSTIITTILTTISFYLDYKEELHLLNIVFKQIEESNTPPLAIDLWTLDMHSTREAGESILKLHDVVKVEIINYLGVNIFSKSEPGYKENSITREFTLFASHVKKKVGILKITATKNHMYQRLYNRAFFLFFSQGFKTFLVSFLMFLIFNYFVIKHLTKISNYLNRFSDEKTSSMGPLILERKSRVGDEIDIVGNAINKIISILVENSTMLEKKVSEKTEELITAKIIAEKANNAKSDFLASVSHEIRTPMNSIMGFTEILKGIVTSEIEKEYLSYISSSGKILLMLINDILDLSKIEAGKIQLKPRPTDMKFFFEEINTIFTVMCNKKSLEFKLEINDEINKYIFMIDDLKLEQVLTNFVANSIKFSSSGLIILRGNIEKIQNSEKYFNLNLEVEDTGIGIPKNQIREIFKPFRQIEGQDINKYGGTGLGLSITKNILELMGGTVEVDSEEGKGSTFKVSIKNIKVCDAQEKSAKIAFNWENVNFHPAKIIIITDLELNKKLIKLFIEKFGFDIYEASNEQEGLELIKEIRPDLIIFDNKMPIIKVLEMIKLVKREDGLKNIPIIILSASFTTEEEALVMKYCDGYIRKPFTRNILVMEIAKYLKFINPVVHDLKKERSFKTYRDLEIEDIPNYSEISEIRNLFLEIFQEEEMMDIGGMETLGRKIRRLGVERDDEYLVLWADELARSLKLVNTEEIYENISNIKKILKKSA